MLSNVQKILQNALENQNGFGSREKGILDCFVSSPNELIKFFIKACRGPGRKFRLRRKHRREFRFHQPPACLPQISAGAWKQSFEEIAETPAIARERYVPHDCKQDDFPSGTLKSLPRSERPTLWPSINLETITSFYFLVNLRTLQPVILNRILPE